MNQMPSGAFSSQMNMPKEKRPHGYNTFAINQFTPEQQQLFSDSFSHLGPQSYLSKLALGDESQFADIEAPALRQFNELQGNIASRFSGMGMGGRRSSGFQNTINAASQDFASQLQSNRQNLRRQAIMDLMGLSNQLLGQRPQERGLVEKPLSGWQQGLIGLSSGLGQGAGQAASAYFGGG